MLSTNSFFISMFSPLRIFSTSFPGMGGRARDTISDDCFVVVELVAVRGAVVEPVSEVIAGVVQLLQSNGADTLPVNIGIDAMAAAVGIDGKEWEVTVVLEVAPVEGKVKETD